MPKGIWKEVKEDITHTSEGEVVITTTTLVHDGDNEDRVLTQLPTERRVIGYYDDVPKEFKDHADLARKRGKPRMTKKQHEQAKAADEANAEMEKITRSM